MTSRKTRFAVFGTILSLLFPSCFSAQAKKPVFKNTQWICIHKMLILDVGTMTETYTIDFTTNKDCVYTYKWVIPAHPASFVREDGTVEMIPSSGSESTFQGTWRYRGGRLTLSLEDGSTQTYHYKDGRLIDPIASTDQLVFEQTNNQ